MKTRLLAFVALLSLAVSAFSQGSYLSPSIVNYTPTSSVGGVLLADVTGNPAPDIYWIDPIAMRVVGTGPFYFPERPGMLALIAQSQDVSSTMGSARIWDPLLNIFRIHRAGLRLDENGNYFNYGFRWQSQFTFVVVTSAPAVMTPLSLP
jgi:hypothetical protein